MRFSTNVSPSLRILYLRSDDIILKIGEDRFIPRILDYIKSSRFFSTDESGVDNRAILPIGNK